MVSETVPQRPEDPPSGTQGAERTGIDKDGLFHVLQNQRRRQVLRYVVTNQPGPFEMREVAEQVAAWENDTTLKALTSQQRQRVYVALYQSHLPKLADYGLIDYNQDRGILDAGPLIGEAVDYISVPDESVDQPDGSEPRDRAEPAAGSSLQSYFLGATVVGVLLVLGAWLSVPVPISGLSVAAFLVAMFGVLTAAMVRQQGR